MKLRIRVMGDLHARYLVRAGKAQRRMLLQRAGVDTNRYSIGGDALAAASVAGFRPRSSTLDTKERIRAVIPETDVLGLAFGQVDLELGYYYRRIIKGEDIAPEGFVGWLLDIYRAFVEDLPIAPERIVFKGVNLTVFQVPDFSLEYISRIVMQEGDPEVEDRIAALRGALLSEREQNAMHLDFNRRLAALAERMGAGYFDINDAIAARGPDGVRRPELGIDPAHAPGGFDHHLSDSLEIRRLHCARLCDAVERMAVPVPA